MSSEVDIRVQHLSKVYRIYEKPEHRLIQMATLGRVRRYTEFAALHDVSLEVRRGETVGIVGRNGCGKSTLLQIICGTLQPSGGSVEVSGRVAALLELGAGFNGEFTGRENVYMNGAILGFNREEMDARFEGIARFADIGDFIERPVKTYSSGMYVRLAFAVATAVEPDILIVDEALAVGDEAFQRKCFARIEAIKERGGTILFVSHGAQTIVQLCDRAVLLDAGEKLMEGVPKAVIAQYQRLINLSGADVEPMRALIKHIDGQASAEGDKAALDTNTRTSVKLRFDRKSSDQKPSESTSLEAFDSTFISQTRVDYETQGATISELKIMNSEGGVVNTLENKKKYYFTFKVSYAVEVKDVAFGMMIKTVNGIELAGIGTNLLSARSFDVRAGQQVLVRMAFDCNLTPGAYFINCGAGGNKSGERVMLHRILDGVIFRVVDSGRREYTGYIDLNIDPEIEVFDVSPVC